MRAGATRGEVSRGGGKEGKATTRQDLAVPLEIGRAHV